MDQIDANYVISLSTVSSGSDAESDDDQTETADNALLESKGLGVGDIRHKAEKDDELVKYVDNKDEKTSGCDNNQVIDAEEQPVSIKQSKLDTSIVLSKFDAFKNLIVLSIAFLLLFTAFSSFESLQSTLNEEEGLGTTGLSVMYATMMLTSLFIVPLTVTRFSKKWIMVVATMTYVIYLATGFYATWSTLIPACIIMGLGGPHLWQAKLSYMSELARKYAAGSNQKEEDVLKFFLGIFFSIYFASQIAGNLASSLLFHNGSVNSTDVHLTNESGQRQCGAAFCPISVSSNGMHMRPPTKDQMYSYTGFCVGIASISAMGLAVLLYNLPASRKPRVSMSKTVQSVVRHMVHSKKQQLLLVPATFRSIAEAFVLGDFTIAFVSCPLGVEYVGFVMMTYGSSSSVSAFIFGRISKYTGTYFPCFTAFVMHVSAAVTMLLWQPDSNKPILIYILVVIWSVGDAALLPTIGALHSLHFGNKKDAALGTYRMFHALGFCVSFGYSSFVCTRYKILIIIIAASASFLSMTAFHICVRKETRRQAKLAITSENDS